MTVRKPRRCRENRRCVMSRPERDQAGAERLLLVGLCGSEGLVGAECLAGSVDICLVDAVNAEVVRHMRVRPGDLVNAAIVCRLVEK